MDDINALNPLQMLASACGQVQSCDFGPGGCERPDSLMDGSFSVGIVLLVVRYGKYGTGGLDALSQGATTSPLPHRPLSGAVGALAWSRPGAGIGEASHHLEGVDRRRATFSEGWTDTEVGLT